MVKLVGAVSSSKELVKKHIEGGNFAVAGDDEIAINSFQMDPVSAEFFAYP